jgi:uncharacterized protein
MRIEGKATMLRIYVGENDHDGGGPLFSSIVMKLREAGVAGATVVRGIEGYGASSRVHTASILRLSQDLPVIIEAVDKPERIAAVLPAITAMVKDGLVTTEEIEVVKYSAEKATRS